MSTPCHHLHTLRLRHFEGAAPNYQSNAAMLSPPPKERTLCRSAQPRPQQQARSILRPTCSAEMSVMNWVMGWVSLGRASSTVLT